MTKVTGVTKHSKLYRRLRDRRLRRATRIDRHPDLHVTKLGGSHDVRLVHDGKSHRKFILKSYEERNMPGGKSRKHMRKEYKRLRQANRIVDRLEWVSVVKPLCKSDRGDFFAEQYVSGTPLGHYMREAMIHGKEGTLYEKLTLLAGFLGRLHKKTGRSSRIGPANIRDELKKHARQASRGGAFTREELDGLERLVEKACSYGFIRDAKKSLVHGDANPSNFLYHPGRMYVIDMERSGYRDPVYDLGMVAGELFHFAMRYAGDPYKADPFIGHFYWIYAGNHRDQLGTFIRLTKRNPLYMANSLLRIARHPHFSREYKRRLAYHAKECLASLKRYVK